MRLTAKSLRVSGFLLATTSHLFVPALGLGTAHAQASAAPDQRQTAPAATDAEPAPQDQSGSTEGEIIVTGSRLGASGFQAPTPVTVIGQDAIQQSGATTVADVLNKLPSFRAVSTPATTSINISNAGSNLADLRGLGSNRTLVLVDGRRFVAGTVAGTNPYSPAGAVDLNMIPTSLIKRVDVVTGGASAAYGSDAIAGVVNLILDTRLEGIKGSLQSGITERGDGRQFLATLAAGTSFAGGRGHFVIGGEYSNLGEIGNCSTRPSCAQEYTPISNPTPQTNGLPRSVLLPNGRTAQASFGGLITSGPLRGTEFASDGSTFQHDYGTYYGAGLFQSGGGVDGVQPFQNLFLLSPPVQRYDGLAHLDFDFSDSLSAFVEGSYGYSHSTSLASQVRESGTITIQRDNAFLPASIVSQMTALNLNSFTFGRIGQDIGQSRGEVWRSTARIVGGLKGKIGAKWSWDAYYQYGQTDYHQRSYLTQINDNFFRAVDAVRAPDGSIVCRSTLTDPTNPLVQGCQPLNLFGQNNFSQAAVNYAFGTAAQDTVLKQHVAAATIRGELFDLPAGAVSVATGVEYRVEGANGTSDPVSAARRFRTNQGAAIVAPDMTVKEAFVELGVPLLRDKPFFKTLELNGAARITDYSTTGTAKTWKVGGVWEPADFLRLRATRSRDIRAPNLFELYAPQTLDNLFLQDPRFGNTSILGVTIGGGNPDLQPEVANTFTAGAVLSPFKRFNVSVDYYDIKIDGVISTVGAQTIVNRCEAGATEFCSLIDRNPTTGQIQFVRNFNLNVAQQITRGLDIEASYRVPIDNGELSLRVLATHVFDLITTDTAGTVNRAGQNGVPPSTTPGIPKWQVNATLGWDKGPFAAQLQGRYISPGLYNVLAIGPDQEGYNPTLPNSISNNHINARFYTDFTTQLDIVRNGRRSFQVFGGVTNIFDTKPPAQAPSSFATGNPILYDIAGRAYKVGVRFSY